MPVKKYSVLVILLCQIMLMGWMTANYITARMHLMEARDVIRGLLYRDTTTKKHLLDGAETKWVADRLSTNQYFEVQYFLRRQVKDIFFYSFISTKIATGEIKLDMNGQKLFNTYEVEYKKWEGDSEIGDFKCYIPLWNQIEMAIYGKWMRHYGLWLRDSKQLD